MNQSPISQESIHRLFTGGHTHHGWLAKPVSDEQLQELYDLSKWPPTCVNGSPLRILFVKSSDAKERLASCLMASNIQKMKSAPVTAILAYDLDWYEKLPQLFPRGDYKGMYASNQTLSEATAFRNSSLQAGYLIMAARSLGLDVGPMSGFDLDKVNKLFFKNSSWRVNFLCNIGYGDPAKLYPRAARLSFDESCTIV